MIRQLYGGYFEGYVPENFVDVSNFRQVPDHQEIFHDYESDHLLTIDLLEYVKDDDISKAAKIHWDEIAFSNQSEYSQILSEEKLNNKNLYGVDYPCYSIIGVQKIAKKNQEPQNITILLCLIRLKDYGTDIIITFCFPKENVTPNDVEFQFFNTFLESFKLNNPQIFGVN